MIKCSMQASLWLWSWFSLDTSRKLKGDHGCGCFACRHCISSRLRPIVCQTFQLQPDISQRRHLWKVSLLAFTVMKAHQHPPIILHRPLMSANHLCLILFVSGSFIPMAGLHWKEVCTLSSLVRSQNYTLLIHSGMDNSISPALCQQGGGARN